jgi:hypothetical protein
VRLLLKLLTALDGSKNKKILNSMEEKVGFEPTVPCGTPDFESGTFGHSATSPQFANAKL